MEQLFSSPDILFALPIIIWEFVWKGVGMWRAARNSQQKWFIAMLLLNTAGILPILYLKFFQKKLKSF